MIDILFRDPGFQRPDVLVQPLKQFEIVGAATHIRHRRMVMRVVERRQDRLVASVDYRFRRQAAAITDFLDPVAFNININRVIVKRHLPD